MVQTIENIAPVFRCSERFAQPLGVFEANLGFEEAYGDFDSEVYDPEESARLIVVARRLEDDC